MAKIVAVVILSLILEASANIDTLLNAFGEVADAVAPERAAKYKKAAEKSRPCLEELLSKVNEDALAALLKSLLPMSVACANELQDVHNVATRQEQFVACFKVKAAENAAQRPELEKEAFAKAGDCLRAIVEAACDQSNG